MRTALLASLFILPLQSVLAQAPGAVQAPASCLSADRPSFDLASIKPVDGNSGSSSVSGTPDGIVFKGSLRRILLFAYSLHDFQIEGGPDWVSTEIWEIHAKNDAPDPDFYTMSQPKKEALRQRRVQQVQSLLADRFALRCHFIAREMQIYELVLAKGGPKLKRTGAGENKQGSFSSVSHGLQMQATATSVGTDRIATMLGNEVDRVVVDKTGLTGTYDLSLDWVRDSTGAADAPAGPTIFNATEEQLGLKLVPAKGMVPIMVIDSVQKASAN